MKNWKLVVPLSFAALVLLALHGVREPSLTVRSVDPSFKILGVHYYPGTNSFSFHYGKHASIFRVLDKLLPRFASRRRNSMVVIGNGPALVVYASTPKRIGPMDHQGLPLIYGEPVRLYDDRSQDAWNVCQEIPEDGHPTNTVTIYFGALSNGFYHLRPWSKGPNKVDIVVGKP